MRQQLRNVKKMKRASMDAPSIFTVGHCTVAWVLALLRNRMLFIATGLPAY